MDKDLIEPINKIITQKERYKNAIVEAIAEFEKAPYDRLRDPYDILKESLQESRKGQ